MPFARRSLSIGLANRRGLRGAALIAVLACGAWPGLAAAEGAAATDTGEKVAAKAAEPVEWSRRYERPTGSRRAVKVCRDKKGIDEGAEVSRQSLQRAQHYGNPTVTPGG
jgi:hypothetical protein